MGILVVQDVQLGALIAAMPLLCFQTASGVAFHRLLKGGVVLCITLLCLLLMCRVVSLFVIDRLFRFVSCVYAVLSTHTASRIYMHAHIQNIDSLIQAHAG